MARRRWQGERFAMKRLRDFFFGRRDVDPEGVPVRIGALWSRNFQPNGWALVACGKIWMKNDATFEQFKRDVRWRAHEHHHIYQERHRFSNTLSYLCAFIWQYIRYRSHSGAPLEKEAEAAADEYMAKLERSQVE
jgi:hypothetical protein